MRSAGTPVWKAGHVIQPAMRWVKYLMEKTGNVAAVQKQLGHKNAAYSMQYARITGDELLEALDGR